MGTILCPRCVKRITVGFDCSDYVHECNSGNPVLDQEDVVVTGNQVTEFGETVTTNVKAGEVNYQGVANRFMGTKAGIAGEHFSGVTRRGKNKNTHRQRQHFQYISGEELKK